MMASEMMQKPESLQIQRLLEPSVFPHAATGLRLLETHISWIILTGEFAYKIKKPVHFDFVDYSTLELRRVNCQKEVKLNQRYSKGIYVDVVPIFSHGEGYRVGESSSDQSDAKPIEFAVKMSEFQQEAILAHLLKNTDFPSERMEPFARVVAEFHDREPAIVVDNLDNEIDKIHAEVNDNFSILRPAFANTIQGASLELIEAWSERSFAELRAKICTRIQNGFLKTCHGDLHLNNIILFDDELVPFDGIEFNPHLQTIDTLNEVAFLFMDLMAYGYHSHAWRFLNAYLEVAGGYSYLDLFRFFAVYRAMVRAKVAWINDQSGAPPVLATNGQTDSGKHPWDRYIRFAEKAIAKHKPHLSITFGFSGSGKSTRALEVVEERGAIRLRSDFRRMQLKQELTTESLYSRETSDRIYRELLADARGVLESGVPVVVDATFLTSEYRAWFRELATTLDIPFDILACDADASELRARIQNRTGDLSEANEEVLQQQIDQHDPLEELEHKYVIR